MRTRQIKKTLKMQHIFDGMSDSSKRLNDALSSLIHSLAEFPKEFDDWQPSNLFSVADTLARIGTVGGLIDSLTTLAPEKFALVPAARITGLATAYSNLVQSVERAKTQFDQIPTWGGFGRFDAPDGQIVAQNGNAVSAKSIFDDMTGFADNVLEAHIPNRACGSQSYGATAPKVGRQIRVKPAEAAMARPRDDPFGRLAQAKTTVAFAPRGTSRTRLQPHDSKRKGQHASTSSPGLE